MDKGEYEGGDEQKVVAGREKKCRIGCDTDML